MFDGGYRRLLDGFRRGQHQPLRLFTPCIPIGTQVGDDRAQLGDQGVGRGSIAGASNEN